MLKQYLVSTIKNLNTERQPSIVLVRIGFADTMIENGTYINDYISKLDNY